MEIRNVTNEVKNEYPKMEQISKKNLSNSIPNKWIKVGLSSLGIAMITKNKAFADSTYSIPSVNIAGGFPVSVPTPIKICNVACPIVQVVSAIIFIITLITIVKAKKQSEPKKVKKWVKILFIISIILFILSILTKIIINNI